MFNKKRINIFLISISLDGVQIDAHLINDCEQKVLQFVYRYGTAATAYEKERITSRSLFDTYHSKMEISSDEKKLKKIMTLFGSNTEFYCWEFSLYYHNYFGVVSMRWHRISQ